MTHMMIFAYRCRACRKSVDLMKLTSDKDHPGPCLSCGGQLKRRIGGAGLLRGRDSERTREAPKQVPDQVNRPASPGSSALNLDAKDCTFSGKWDVQGYDTVFAGDYENCDFSADITHRIGH